jgi:hypothetical protein
MFRLVPFIAAPALVLSGCGTRGNDSANAANQAQGTTQNGQLTARVQGVDLKINLPPPIRRMAEDDNLLYPGARGVRGPGQRFHSDDSTETVAGWYQDPARHNRFSIDDSTQNDDSWLLTGTARGGDTFSVRLTPGSRGGTDGTIAVTPAG